MMQNCETQPEKEKKISLMRKDTSDPTTNKIGQNIAKTRNKTALITEMYEHSFL